SCASFGPRRSYGSASLVGTADGKLPRWLVAARRPRAVGAGWRNVCRRHIEEPSKKEEGVGVDDYVSSEAGVVAAATAAAVSPRARELFRRGAVYGLAGVMKATDVAVTAAQGAVRRAKQGAAAASGGTTSGGSNARSGGS